MLVLGTSESVVTSSVIRCERREFSSVYISRWVMKKVVSKTTRVFGLGVPPVVVGVNGLLKLLYKTTKSNLQVDLVCQNNKTKRAPQRVSRKEGRSENRRPQVAGGEGKRAEPLAERRLRT